MEEESGKQEYTSKEYIVIKIEEVGKAIESNFKKAAFSVLFSAASFIALTYSSSRSGDSIHLLNFLLDMLTLGGIYLSTEKVAELIKSFNSCSKLEVYQELIELRENGGNFEDIKKVVLDKVKYLKESNQTLGLFSGALICTAAIILAPFIYSAMMPILDQTESMRSRAMLMFPVIVATSASVLSSLILIEKDNEQRINELNIMLDLEGISRNRTRENNSTNK